MGTTAELDPELFIVETDEECDVENDEQPFDYNQWTLKSGLAVIDLLKVAAEIETKMIEQLQDEDNEGTSKLSGRLPPHPGKPDREQRKKGTQIVEVRID
ncbi:14821_t:CDS:2, partial [Racocetra fulgida]